MCGDIKIGLRSSRLLPLAMCFAAAAMAAPRFASADEPAKAKGPAQASQPAAQPSPVENISGWIQQLGDDRFEVREEASRHLSQMGIEIQPALDNALHSPDPEIRVRVRRILDTIVKADLEKRLNAFAEDVNDTKHLDLPGWARYRQVVGATGSARQLFVEMQRAEPNLFRAVEEGPTATSQSLENSITQELVQMQVKQRFAGGYAISLSAVSAMLFVGSDKQETLPDDLAMQLVFLTNQPAIQQTMNGGAQAAPVKKILGAWVSHDACVNVLSQNLWLAMRFDLKEGVEPAANALKQGNQPANIKQTALMLIGKLGDKSNLPAVETCLKDTDICAQGMMNNQQFQTQVGDVALAIAIKLQGEDPKKFGFDRLDTNGLPYYNPATLGFRTAADRESAMKKWDAWVAAHRGTADASSQGKKS
jgi:hypothetical protein